MTADPPRRAPFGEGERAARARRFRSIAIAVALLAFCVLIFAVTMIRLGNNMHHG